MNLLIFCFVTASSWLRFLSVAVPWRAWLEFVAKNAWIPVVLIIAIGFSLILFFLRRWVSVALKHLESIQVGVTALATDANNATTAVGNINKALEEQISKLEKSAHKEVDPANLSDQGLKDDRENTTAETPIPAPVTIPSDGDETNIFPSSVADCLRSAEKNNLTRIEAKSDVLRGGNLISSTEGHFMVIHDAISKNEDIAVPLVVRFSSNEEFSIYFRDYFVCDAPAAGEVWITSPAIVLADEIVGGWRLIKKGQLRVK
jgi:hypothetical protein